MCFLLKNQLVLSKGRAKASKPFCLFVDGVIEAVFLSIIGILG